MSQYTTEIRYICEEVAGKNMSVEYPSVAAVINASWGKIFDFNFPLFDPSYKETLCKKILYHFYTREIGLESYGLWKLKLQVKMNEIMPFYNRLYKALTEDFNPLNTVDIKEVGNYEDKRNKTDTEKTKSTETNETNSRNVTSNTSNVDGSDTTNNTETTTDGREQTVNVLDAYSETPQGAVTNLLNNKYLTNARNTATTTQGDGDIKVVLNGKGTNHSKTTDSGTETGTSTNVGGGTKDSTFITAEGLTHDFLNHKYGYEGINVLDVFERMAQQIIDVDLMIIGQLEELFMQIW